MKIRSPFCAILALGPFLGLAQSDPFQEIARGYTEALTFSGTVVMRRGVDEPETIRLDFAKKRDMMYSIIHPSTRQGFAVIDDYKKIRIYDPSTNSLVVRQSPVTYMMSASTQTRLMKKNYSVESSESVKYLGRAAYKIELEPKSTAMYKRSVIVDKELPLVLRNVGWQGSGAKQVFSEVTSLSLQSRLPEPFKLGGNRDTRLREFKTSITLNQVKLVSGLMGYTPKRGVKLGHGLTEFAGYLVETSKTPVLIRKVSDGVALLTVFEWDLSDADRVGDVAATYRSKNIGFVAIGDAPNSVLLELAKTYALAQQGKADSAVRVEP